MLAHDLSRAGRLFQFSRTGAGNIYSAFVQDNDNFFNTGIIFPISLKQIRVNGFESRLVALPVRGFSTSVFLTHSHTVSTPPFTGELFLGNSAIQALSMGPFVIDHDQQLGMHITGADSGPARRCVSTAGCC